MKTLATTFLSLMILFQSSGPVTDWCCELLKLPKLIEHYKEQAADTGITFIGFLDYHYGDQEKSEKHEDDNHDGELPLQGHHSCSHGISFVDPVVFELNPIEIPENKKRLIFYRPSFSTASLGSIFQPPQI